MALLVFVLLGFNLQAQINWTQMDGIYGSRINYFRPCGDRIFATDVFQTFYYSDDQGLNWNTTNDLGEINNVLLFHDTLFATGVINSNFYFGLIYSTDFGLSWTSCTSCPAVFVLIEENEDYIFAESDDGVYRSSDGVNWELLEATSSFSASLIKVYENQIVNIGLFAYYSGDNGDSWTALTSSNGNIYGVRSVCMNDTAIIEVCAAGVFYCKEVNQWIPINYNLPAELDVYSCYQVDNTLFIKTSMGLYYLSNADNYWIKYQNIPYYSDNGTLAKNGDAYYYISDIGIFYSIDLTAPWQERSYDFKNTDVKGFCFDDEIYAALSKGRLFTSMDKGETWNVVPVDVSNANVPMIVHNHELLFSSGNGLYSYAINQAQITLDDELPFFSELKSHNGRVYGCSFWGLFYKVENDSSWQQYPSIGYYVNDVAFESDTIFVCNETQGVMFSTNGGTDWMTMNEGLGYDIFFGDTIYYYPQMLIAKDKLYGLCENSLGGGSKIQFYSNDQQRWIDTISIPTSVVSNFDYINELEIIDGTFYLGALGIFKYFQETSEWVDITDNIWSYGNGSQKNIYKINTYDDRIFVSAEDAGVWHSEPLTILDATQVNSFSVFPNPGLGFYSIHNNGESKDVSLKVYDVSGKIIKEIKMQDYTQTIDIRGFPNGIYILKIDKQSLKIIKN